MVDVDLNELDVLTIDEATLAEEEDEEALVIENRRIFTDKLVLSHHK